MKVFVFGNPDLPADSIPLQILPQLKLKFPKINFIVQDPVEEWSVPDNLFILDTVVGLDKVEIISDISKIISSPRLTLHDFDVASQLKFLQKLGKLKKVTIIGVPSEISLTEALEQASATLLANQL